jgi:Flp pilus assembly protein TadG
MTLLRSKIFTNIAGNVAVVFALSLSTILLAAGTAIDYSRSTIEKTRIQSAFDAAALSAALDTSHADATARAMVAADLPPGFQLSKLLVTYDKVANNVTVSGTTLMPTSFMKMFGVSAIQISTTSVAAVGFGNLEVWMALDRSSSMGIGADAASRATLASLTRSVTPGSMAQPGGGCAFACHVREGWEPGGADLYTFAKNMGVTIKEDVLVAAAGTLAQTITTKLPGTTIGVIDFSDDTTLALAPTQDISKISAAINTPSPSIARNTTQYEKLFPSLLTMVESQGGVSQVTNAQKLIVMVTDGAYTTWVPGADKAFALIDPAMCDSVKAKGFTLAVVDTEYYNPYLSTLAFLPDYSKLPPLMKACASPGWYFLGGDTNVLKDAFSALSQKIIESNLRLTQ